MRKQTANLEWHIAESDAEWEHQCTLLLPDITPASRRRLRQQRYLWSIVTALLLLSGVGWWRHTTQVQLQAAETELRAPVQQKPLMVATPNSDGLVTTIMNERRSADWWRQHAWEYSALPAPVQPDDSIVSLDVVSQTVEWLGEQAIASVVLTDQNGKPVYRQTRFYRRISNGGWIPITPDATLWGAARTLETPSFVYHFGEKDAATVLSVAPQMDVLYTTLQHNFGLAIAPTREKRFIEVSVTQLPGQATVFDVANHLSVASPAVYLAPVDLTDAELLAQAIALPLIEQVLAQASEQHAVAASWQPLLNGLRLWQVWDLDLPLAVWRVDVVQWIYRDLPATPFGQSSVLPDRYAELCITHKLWMTLPLQLHIPLQCARPEWEEQYGGRLRPPLWRLDLLTTVARPVRMRRKPARWTGLATPVRRWRWRRSSTTR